MILEIDGKRYRHAGLDLSPRDILTLQVELVDAPFTAMRSYDEVATTIDVVMSLPKSERRTHPEFLFCSVVLAWATMRGAGEQITLGEILDWPGSKWAAVRLLAEPGDHTGGDAGEGKAPRPDSGAGGRPGKRKKRSRR